MKRVSLVLVLVLVILLGACTTVSFQGIQAVKDMPNFTVIGDFEKKISDTGLLGATGGIKLVSFGQPDHEIFTAIQNEIQKLSGDAAINVEIAYTSSLMNILLNGCTGSVIAPSTIVIRGTVVKFSD